MDTAPSSSPVASTPNAENPVNPTHLLYVAADGSSVLLPVPDAMARYAADGFTGRLTDPTVTTPAPVAADPAPVAPQPAATASVVQTPTDAGAVAAQARNASQMAVLDAMGFALPQPFFSVGTPLIQAGKDKFRAMAVDHAQKPFIEDAAMEVANAITAEKRANITVALRDLVVTPDGKVSRGKTPIPLEPLAWDTLVGMAAPVLPSAKSLLRILDPDLRAETWNRQVAKLPDTARAQLGIRNVNDGWQVFRAVSATYPTTAQADKVLRGVADALKGEGMRGSVVYDPASTRVRWEAAWMAPQEIDPRVGDVLRVGVAGSTADAANGGFRVSLAATRILCINLTIADAYLAAFRRSHRGNLDGVVDEIVATVKAAPEAFAALAADWKVTRKTAVSQVSLFGKTYADVPTALAALVDTGRIDAGVARDVQVEALLTAYKAEEGDTLADLLNAVTRAAHEASWSEFNRSMLEHQAGELLPVFARAAAA
jgi:hypothetical protein